MIAFSKFALTEVAPKYLGPFDSVPYTCYEFGHTWNSSCVGSWRDLFVSGILFAIKVYTPLYLIGALVKLRQRDVNRKKVLKNTLRGLLQSIFFLGMTGTLFIFCFCAYGVIFGKYHGVFAFVSGFFASLFAIVLERKSRRGLLAIYLLNLALECLFKMAVSRGYVTPINKGEVYLFAATSMVYLSLFRASNLPPGIQNLFEKAIGREETATPLVRLERHGEGVNRNPFISTVKKAYNVVINWLDKMGPEVPSCQHKKSCLSYAASGGIKYFTIGYAIEILLQYRHIFQAITNRKFALLRKCFFKFALAKFLFAFVTLFRVVNCFLRWSFGCDKPLLFGGISGFLAGLSSYIYPSTSITMYAFSKLLDILCMKAVSARWLPYFPNFDIFLYSVSMATLFHAAIFEPQNIRPSYWRFICGLSGEKFPLMFRIMLDKYGTQASKLYPDFVPNLDPMAVQTEEVKRVLDFFGKWPYALM